jgi:hypothetical protein
VLGVSLIIYNILMKFIEKGETRSVSLKMTLFFPNIYKAVTKKDPRNLLFISSTIIQHFITREINFQENF